MIACESHLESRLQIKFDTNVEFPLLIAAFAMVFQAPEGSRGKGYIHKQP